MNASVLSCYKEHARQHLHKQKPHNWLKNSHILTSEIIDIGEYRIPICEEYREYITVLEKGKYIGFNAYPFEVSNTTHGPRFMIWDLENNRFQTTIQSNNSISFPVPIGDNWVSSDCDPNAPPSSMTFYDFRTGQATAEISTGAHFLFYWLVFDKYVIVSVSGDSVSCLDLENGNEIFLIENDDWIENLEFHDDGLLKAVSADEVLLYDLQTFDVIQRYTATEVNEQPDYSHNIDDNNYYIYSVTKHGRIQRDRYWVDDMLMKKMVFSNQTYRDIDFLFESAKESTRPAKRARLEY
jgi:hypothetical protein